MKKLPEVGGTVWFLSNGIRKGVVDMHDQRWPGDVRVNGLWLEARDTFGSKEAAARYVAKRNEARTRAEYNVRSRAEEVAIRNVKRATDARQKAGHAWEKAKAALAATKGKV